MRMHRTSFLPLTNGCSALMIGPAVSMSVVYYSYFDTAINKYLIQRAGFRPMEDECVGYCVHSNCTFREAFTTPSPLTLPPN